MSPIPLFVEVCAGTAAVSLRLHRRGARPPVSRMGSKAGYADTILAALGLTPGQGAERYLWAEADPGVRLLLAAYTDRRLAQGAAEIIRGGAGEEPRALWERLRAEGPCKGAPGADAREVARFILMGVWSYRQSEPDSGFIGPGQRRQDTTATATATAVERVAFGLRGLVVDRADFSPPKLPAGTVVLMDPPYRNTTPYAHDLPRGEVVRIARAWRDAGARVAVCEAEPIGELVEEGWAFIDIADQRVGQKRTFSKQQREVLTMSEPAAKGWRKAEQTSLFGGAR